jgi:hypothetical protein
MMIGSDVKADIEALIRADIALGQAGRSHGLSGRRRAR